MARPQRISIDILPEGPLADDVRAAWAKACEDNAPCHISHSPMWLEALRTTGTKPVWAVRVRDGDRLLGYLNVVAESGSIGFTVAEKPLYRIPVSMGAVSYPGWPLAAPPETCRDVLFAILDAFPRFDGLRISTVPLDDPVFPLLENEAAARDHGIKAHWSGHPQRRHVVDDPSLRGRFEKRFSSKTRHTIQRKWRRMAAEFGDARLEVFKAPERVEKFIDEARKISEKSWQGRHLGERIRENDKVWMTELARSGAFLSFILYAGDRPAAFCAGKVFQGTYYYDEVAYDPAFKDYSPGRILLYELAKTIYTPDEGVTRIDFQYGHAAYKDQFSTTDYAETYYFLYRRRPGLLAALALQRFYARAYDLVKAPVEKLGLKSRLRKFLRGT
ncbi:MAG: GNAT family N-acetyltransferase [Deltaproteobacteria bacterium]|nr:GNAT family N-acetyltransferase [Deltaproteobacteria bacterium]